MQDESFRGVGGVHIHATSSWPGAVAARGVVVIAHGFNSHSGYYRRVTARFVERGLAVYALDHRGRGKSQGERYFVDGFSDYVDDLASLVSRARARAPTLPCFLLGHSAGGVMACIYALDHPEALAGLICESFAFQVYAPDLALALLKGFSHVAPHAHVLRLAIDGFSRDPAVIDAMKRDPMVAHEVQPTQTVAEMVRADERLRREFGKITLPLLILHGTADRVSKPGGSQLFYDRAGSEDKTLKLYDGHVHDLLNDVGHEVVVSDILTWIDERTRG